MGLKSLRESKKLTQDEVARVVKASRSTVAMWESQGTMPRADKLPILAKLFDCSIDDLFEKEEERQEDQKPLSVTA